MVDRIIVINPNSTKNVTDAMDKAFEPLRIKGAPLIESITNSGGPPGIECQQDADGVAIQIVNLIKKHEKRANAFVVACFSDPGIYAAREVTKKPVFGIAESSILTALSLGDRFGIIAILERSIPRHLRYIRSLGLEARLAGDLAIGVGVTALNNEVDTFARMEDVGKELRDERGASVLIMGCAGMASYRLRLQDRLGVMVIDPSQAAVSMAVSAIQLQQTNTLI
ncbi:MAG: Asp/Glu racemase [Rhodospirillaceae bacterium]|nr:Asp/Glu racemase [Rhodospirillaceae bacterium]|tara:strand:- start:120 stop:794 length:675 start_codon:yes stop_codon:yes gene_type:complete